MENVKMTERQESSDVPIFSPCTCTLSITGGLGGEAWAGIVRRDIYDFFKELKIDIEEFALWEEEGEEEEEEEEEKWGFVPKNKRPFDLGNSYSCDNIYHVSGAELSDICYITVSDNNGDAMWKSTSGQDNLEEAGVNVALAERSNFDELAEGAVVFLGQLTAKGTFFEGELELTEPFDPKKLTIYFDDIPGWQLISGVEYNGVEIDGEGGLDTIGKGGYANWFIVGDEEVYEGERRYDDD